MVPHCGTALFVGGCLQSANETVFVNTVAALDLSELFYFDDN